MARGRRPLIAGNWKMHGTRGEADALLAAVRQAYAACGDRDVLVAPPYTLLEFAARALAGSGVLLAGQDMFWERSGAYTGAISPLMLADAGCTHVIIGHSERRQYFGETDTSVNDKARLALACRLTPIVCVGETLGEREADATAAVIERQVRTGLAGFNPEALARVIIAYEPVWAIGTGKVATPAQAEEVHVSIRGWIRSLGGETVAAECRILYGGSVKPDNVDALMAEADIDGALVGGASLQADAFARIVRFQR